MCNEKFINESHNIIKKTYDEYKPLMHDSINELKIIKQKLLEQEKIQKQKRELLIDIINDINELKKILTYNK